MTFVREARMKDAPEIVDGFRMRGREVSRLESFADAIFGFALTLLVVSLDVPKTIGDFFNALRGFPAFAFCFLLLALIWNSHYKYCRRFGLDDGWSRFLTCVLLFLVLFYVYPLKFLLNLGITGLVFPNEAPHISMTRAQYEALQITFAFGFTAVYLVLTLLYVRAYHLRDRLELTTQEKVETRYQIARLLFVVAMGIIVAILSVLPWTWRWGSVAYVLLFPIMRISSVMHRRKRKALAAASVAG